MVNAVIRWCLNNTFLVVLATLAVIGGGWYALRRTPVDAIPDIGEKQVIVVAEWSGRSPQDVDDQVTYPLTVALQGTPGVKVIRGMSGFGFSMVFVIFRDEIDYYWARSRVLERMNVARAKLPAGVEPVLGPDATALGQVFWYTVEGEGFDLAELRATQDWYIRYHLNAVEGVSEVASVGGYVKQYQIDVDPVKMRAHGVTLPEITEAVRKSNIDVGAKVIEINEVEFFLRGVGFVKTPADLENVVIRAREGTPLYVKNVATVSLGPEFRRGALDKEGVEAVGGVVTMRYGENPLAVIDRVKEKIKEIEPGLPTKTLPDGRLSKIRIVPFYDRTGIIYETMDTLREALVEEALVAALVVGVFLLHLRSSVAIVAATLPTSIGVSFLAMYLLGVDANIMSLAGLAIAIGDVCDMGLIMTENIYRHIAKNDGSKTYYQCVEEGACEVGTAIVTAVSNTIVSFIPVFALQDQEGKLFGPLAYTKTFAITASAILAVTVVPTLSYHLLKPIRLSRRRSLLLAAAAGATMTLVAGFAFREFFLPESAPASQGWLVAGATGAITALVLYRMARERLVPLEQNVVSRGILAVYVPSLRWVLHHKAAFLTIPVALMLLGLTIWFGWERVTWPVEAALAKAGINVNQSKGWSYLRHRLPGLGREFMPALDEGSLLYMPSLVPAGSLSAVQKVISTQDMAIRTVPEVESVVGKLGRVESALDPAPVGMIETIIMLKPADQWRMVPQDRFYRGWPEWTKGLLRRVFPDERRITKDEILDELRRKTDIPGVLPTWLQPIQTRIVMLQTGFRAMMGVKIYGDDLRTIERIGLELEGMLKQVPGAADVVADRIVGKPYIEFRIDREKIARYGVNIRDVQDVIELAVGGENLTTTVEGRQRYPIRVRYPRELRDNLEELERILVPAADGAHIPITQVAEIHYALGPQEIKSENTRLVGYVTLNARQRDEVSVVEDAKAMIDARIEEDERLKRPDSERLFPAGYSYKFAGQYENQVRAMDRLKLLIPICLVVDFVLLYLGFDRWWVAVLVFSGILVSASGGFLMLLFYGFNLSVAVWVGFIALFGVAEDDGVVMATYLGQLFDERKPTTIQEVRDLVIEAGMKRIRPCLMTTATTVLGLLPVFLTEGRGSDVMQPMAIPSVGGMAVQLITLFIVPCVYCLVEEWKLRRRNKPDGAPKAHGSTAGLGEPDAL
jgi:Cu(I)/Ag(I) efflux system membrane protein CusA/SilA